jgi:hypothetical protein
LEGWESKEGRNGVGEEGSTISGKASLAFRLFTNKFLEEGATFASKELNFEAPSLLGVPNFGKEHFFLLQMQD